MHYSSSFFSFFLITFSFINLCLHAVFPILITPSHAQTVATLSSEEWSVPQPILLELHEDETPGAFHTAVYGGTTYLVFNTDVGLNPKDIYFTCRKNGTWTLPRKLSKSNAPATTPRFVIDITSVANSPVLHVIWGEATGNSPLPRPGGGPITDIFYTTHEGETWSDPTSLYHTELPGLQLPEHLIVDKTGTLHLGFVARDAQTRKPTIFHMCRDDGNWSAPPSIPDARYIDFVALEEEKLLVTYLRADHAWAKKMKTRDVNSIFVQQSLDGGMNWDEAVLVHRSGTKPAFAPHFLKGHAGTLHLFWRKSNDQTTLSNTVLHSYSQDGISWSQPTQITGDLEGMLFSFDIISDKSGKLHAVFHLSQHVTKPPFRYYYTCYENGTWSTPYPLLPEHLFDFSKAGREIALTVVQDSLQVILRAREQGAEDFRLYRMTRPLLSE